MKKYIIFTLFCMLMVFSSCKSSDNFTNDLIEKIEQTQSIVELFEGENQKKYIQIEKTTQQSAVNSNNDYYITLITTGIAEAKTSLKIIKLEKTKISEKYKLKLDELFSIAKINVEKAYDLEKNNEYTADKSISLYLYNSCTYISNANNLLLKLIDFDDITNVAKNSNKNIDTLNRQKNNANQYYSGYNYGYGQGYSNPFFGYGGMYNGFGMYGYGGSPYMWRNPYIPNVDTFGIFKNIDTYKPIEISDDNEE